MAQTFPLRGAEVCQYTRAVTGWYEARRWVVSHGGGIEVEWGCNIRAAHFPAAELDDWCYTSCTVKGTGVFACFGFLPVRARLHNITG